jgi:putative ABC transport system permease protein
MFTNYLKVAWRNIKRHKGFAFINIAGLAMGVAAGLLVLIYVGDELSYDRFHAKADRIYRIGQKIHIDNRIDSALPGPSILAAALAKNFPVIESTARLKRVGGAIVRVQDKGFGKPEVFAANPGFFEVFSFRLIDGDPRTALAAPNQVVLTQSAAQRCFGGENPLGRVLTIGEIEFKVSGIMENIPRNSHFHFEFLTSDVTYPRSQTTGWFDGFCATYLVLKKGANPKALEKRFPAFVLDHLYGGKKSQGLFKDWEYFLQPFTEIHLRSHLLIGELEANSSGAYVSIFSAIAFFVLLIAGVNFVNLSTARASLRAREVGIRKVVGSDRSRLIRQFLGESVLQSVVSVGLALVLVAALLPAFRNLTGKEIFLSALAGSQAFLFLVFLALLVGFGSGIYPAFVLSSFRPAGVLKGSLSAGAGSRSSALRKGLIVVQFAVSVFLLIGSAVVSKQTNFVQSKRLGYDREHVLVVRDANLLGNQRMAFKEKLLRNPDIQTVAATTFLPGAEDGHASLNVLTPEGVRDGMVMENLSCDPDLRAALKLEMAAGRFFATAYPSDDKAIIINEEAARQIGWSQPLGKILRWNKKEFTVIGVVKDFHLGSLHAKIPRLVMTLDSNDRGWSDLMAVRIRPSNVEKVLNSIKTAWNSFSPPLPLNYSFLDEDYARLYSAEARTGKIIAVFSALAVLISCLGLFGLASFMTDRRKKEIGIRKVLGARVAGVVGLLAGDFLGWVLIANVLAWPAAYILTNQWLRTFAYRTDIGIPPFLLALALSLITAAAALSFQTVKAASANPADALRTE